MRHRFAGEKPVIAVVDDDVDDQLIIQEAFSSSRFPVKILGFSRPMELEAYLQENVGKPEFPHLIILDLYNDGRTTLECISRIKSVPMYGGLPIVMMSGSSDQTHVQQFYRVGGASFIPKPISFEDWQHTLSVLCEYWFGVVLLPEYDG